MKEIKNILICGLGAIGTIYAAKFFKHTGLNLKILIDESRLSRYKDSYTCYNGEKYKFDFVLPSKNDFKADLVIIATKNKDFETVLNNIKNYVSEDTIIMSLLNGLKSEENIIEQYGENHLLYSYFIGHTSTRNGREITQDGVYKTVFGEKYNNAYSDKVICVKKLFDKTNIPYDIPVDMEYSNWWKFVLNVGYNQASALLNADYNAFQKSQKINNIAIKLMEETVAVAKALGVNNTEKIIPDIIKVIEKMLPETRTSMLQDIDAKRQTEVDAFSGYVIELSEKYGIETPYNKFVYECIKAIDEKNLIRY